MGSPKKLRKKYTPPRHPWQGARIIAEKVLVREYGLKNKKEIYKALTFLRNFAKQAKNLVTIGSNQQEKEKEQLFTKLKKLNLINVPSLDHVLGLTLKDILNRRLQTLVYKKGLAKTITQSRQFVSHGHIEVKGQKVVSPGYLVNVEEENEIKFVKNSNLSNAEHPERVIKEVQVKQKNE